jgi:RimJ/RimL family protein N-acetyltransferase
MAANVIFSKNLGTFMRMILETDRLRIRKLTLDDTPFFYELLNDKDWIRFIGDRNIQTHQDAQDYLANKIIPSYTHWGFGFYLVVEKASNNSLGIAGFVDRDELEFVDIGFAFLPKGRGKGYALEAAKALMKFGTSELQFETILGIANKDNVRSHRLLEKLGLSFQGYVQLDDEEEEICLFSTSPPKM